MINRRHFDDGNNNRIYNTVSRLSLWNVPVQSNGWDESSYTVFCHTLVENGIFNIRITRE